MIGFSVVFGTLSGYAQRDTSRLLDTLVIQQAPYSSVRSGRPMQYVDLETLKTSQASNLAEALRHMAGVQMRDYGGLGGMKTLDVRSMGGHHTGLMYNGMAVNNAQNGVADLSRFSVKNLKAIRLYNGQPDDLSLPAHAFASASVLMLDTREARGAADAPALSASLTTGSFGLLNPGVDWHQRLSEATAMRVSAEWKQWDGGYPYRQPLGIQRDTLIDRANSDMQALRVETRLEGALDSLRPWALHAYAYRGERGLPGASVQNNYNRMDRQWDEDLFLQGHLQAHRSERYRLLVYGKYQYKTLRYLDPRANTSLGYIDNRYFEHSLDVSAVQVFRWNANWSSALATDYRFGKLDANLPSFAYPRRHKLLANLSTRWEAGSFSMQGNLLGTYWSEHSRYQASFEQKPVWSPSVAATFRPFNNESLYFRAFYKSIFRMPTFNDRYYAFVGTLDLKPEYTRQYNLGITWERKWKNQGGLQWTLDVYENRIKDRITAIPTSNLFLWTMVNLGKVRIRGLDAGVQIQAETLDMLRWHAGLKYTFQDAQDVTPGGNFYQSQIPYAPRHSGSLYLALHWKYWGLQYGADYTGKRYSQRWNAPENLLDDWLLQDLGLSYSNCIFSMPVRLSASIRNLANTSYVAIRSFPMPGRHYRIELQFEF